MKPVTLLPLAEDRRYSQTKRRLLRPDLQFSFRTLIIGMTALSLVAAMARGIDRGSVMAGGALLCAVLIVLAAIGFVWRLTRSDAFFAGGVAMLVAAVLVSAVPMFLNGSYDHYKDVLHPQPQEHYRATHDWSLVTLNEFFVPLGAGLIGFSIAATVGGVLAVGVRFVCRLVKNASPVQIMPGKRE